VIALKKKNPSEMQPLEAVSGKGRGGLSPARSDGSRPPKRAGFFTTH